MCVCVDAACKLIQPRATVLPLHCVMQPGGMDLLDYVVNKEDFEVDKDGYIAVLPKPGLGIVVDEAAVRKAAAAGHSWKDREWELPDGTPTTW